MNLINLTPHAIVVRPDEGLEFTIQPSGTAARCPVSSEKVSEIAGVPVVRQVFGRPMGVPEPVADTIYIASTLVAQTAGRTDVVSPDTGATAYRENGQVVAVRGFQTFPPSRAEQAIRDLIAEFDEPGSSLAGGDPCVIYGAINDLRKVIA